MLPLSFKVVLINFSRIKTHGQNQRVVRSRVEVGMAGVGGVVGVKWRQLYLNNNKKSLEKNNIQSISHIIPER